MRRLVIVFTVLGAVVLLCINAAAALPAPAPNLTTTPTRAGIFLPLVRSLPTPTPTPLPTITPLPAGVLVLHETYYTSYNEDQLNVVGEVLNNTGGSVASVTIPVGAFNNDGEIMGNGEDIPPMVLRPGEKTCFNVLIFLDPDDNWSSYALGPISYVPTNAATPNLTLLNVSSDNDLGPYHITGQVRNDSGVKVTSVSLIVTLYDSSGTMVDCNSTTANPSVLNPGQTSTFDIWFSYSYASYRIQTGGDLP
jgi:hypothetical protein